MPRPSATRSARREKKKDPRRHQYLPVACAHHTCKPIVAPVHAPAHSGCPPVPLSSHPHTPPTPCAFTCAHRLSGHSPTPPPPASNHARSALTHPRPRKEEKRAGCPISRSTQAPGPHTRPAFPAQIAHVYWQIPIGSSLGSLGCPWRVPGGSPGGPWGSWVGPWGVPGPRMAPRWPRISPRQPQDGPSWAILGPSRAILGPS